MTDAIVILELKIALGKRKWEGDAAAVGLTVIIPPSSAK
jgi:hypothetical protein